MNTETIKKERLLAVHEWRCLELECSFTSIFRADVMKHLNEVHGYPYEKFEHRYDDIALKVQNAK